MNAPLKGTMNTHASPSQSFRKEGGILADVSRVVSERPPDTDDLATTNRPLNRGQVFLCALKLPEPIFRRVALCTLLYSLPLISLSQPVLDPDMWWHVRTGEWVVGHGWVTATDPFSTFGHGRPWVAYSWLYEILVYGIFRAFGLVGIWIFRAVTTYAIAVALHRLLASREPRFDRIAGLLAAAFVALLSIDSERPWQFSILFSIMTLAVIEALRGAPPLVGVATAAGLLALGEHSYPVHLRTWPAGTRRNRRVVRRPGRRVGHRAQTHSRCTCPPSLVDRLFACFGH